MGKMRELVESHYRNFHAADTEAEHRIFSPNVITVDPGAGRMEGIAAGIQYDKSFLRAFPGSKIEVLQLVEGENVAIVQGMFHAKHTGPMEGPSGDIAPTGRELKLPFADVFVAKDGLITEHHVYYDQVTFLSQLGLMHLLAS